jgi:uncharacterized membrane protein
MPDINNKYIYMSPSQVQLFILVSFLMCILFFILVLHVSGVRHLKVLCTYLLAEDGEQPKYVVLK